MPKVYIGTHAETVTFARVCSNCSHQWTASFDLHARSMAESTDQKAAQSAADLVAVQRKEKRENCDVLCPQCSHFTVDAMRRHFTKGGVAGGILKKYKQAVWMSLLGVLGFGWLPTVIFFFAYWNPQDPQSTWFAYIWILLLVGFGAISLYKLIGFIWGITALPSVKRKVNQLSDDGVLELAVACYQANKNSLDATDLDQIKWNVWLSKPLSYKAAPEMAAPKVEPSP